MKDRKSKDKKPNKDDNASMKEAARELLEEEKI